jgi:uncharacterized protein YdhG (YjbR/CyaY superfamily)
MDKTVAEYMAEQAPPFRAMLEDIRSIIYSVVPDATEAVSYGVPCFKYLDYLVGMGVAKKYCSLYLMSNEVANLLKEQGYEFLGTKTTVHFPVNEPLPVALIKKIVKERVKQNEAKAKKKKAK